MLGASLYLSEGSQKNIEYIKRMNKVGIIKVFTSLHIPEDDTSKTLNVLKDITRLMDELSMELIPDISSGTIAQYGLTKENAISFFKNLQIKTLRIDYGFTFEEIKEFSKEFNIVLNASVIDEKYYEELRRVELDSSEITVCHNFYPRENTGLDRNFFIERNRYLKMKGFNIIAFIAGNKDKRGPVFAGLPTLEEHRYLEPLEAYLDLTDKCLVDEVLIGDISISDPSLTKLMKYLKEDIIVLPIKDVQENLLPENFYSVHTNRKDVAADVIRGTESRIILKDQIIQPGNCKERRIGSVTIDNSVYGRYAGEIQVSKRDLPFDSRVNVLATVKEEYLGLLPYIGPARKFQFNAE
ncbi:MupG family TIM beta-alpha barrel fold protein [Desemzia incerta]|uniref:MupG family TIM beta-alpha barrel fold protein n=1 Tax=Desemzia incerta TaxID=82801 RepID=UPI0024C25637|nr:MupG family TIM beta-alpha barrel fold protein [Desemzia incerta]WHZ32885.1 MupG family TIM beta-alpha barrel fold protein [Desemzia incerta]